MVGTRPAKRADWTCAKCSNVNYGFRVECNRCQQPKKSVCLIEDPGLVAGSVEEFPAILVGDLHNHRHFAKASKGKVGAYVDGDAADGHVEAAKNAPKDLTVSFKEANGVGRTSRPGSGASNGSGNSKRITKPGDWRCPACHNINYSFRDACNRCEAPKDMYHFGPAAATSAVGTYFSLPGYDGGLYQHSAGITGSSQEVSFWTCQCCGIPNSMSNTGACESCKTTPESIATAVMLWNMQKAAEGGHEGNSEVLPLRYLATPGMPSVVSQGANGSAKACSTGASNVTGAPVIVLGDRNSGGSAEGCVPGSVTRPDVQHVPSVNGAPASAAGPCFAVTHVPAFPGISKGFVHNGQFVSYPGPAIAQAAEHLAPYTVDGMVGYGGQPGCGYAHYGPYQPFWAPGQLPMGPVGVLAGPMGPMGPMYFYNQPLTPFQQLNGLAAHHVAVADAEGYVRKKEIKDEWRPGDWQCVFCKNHNYRSRRQCNRCKKLRPATTDPEHVGDCAEAAVSGTIDTVNQESAPASCSDGASSGCADETAGVATPAVSSKAAHGMYPAECKVIRVEGSPPALDTHSSLSETRLVLQQATGAVAAPAIEGCNSMANLASRKPSVPTGSAEAGMGFPIMV
eukprot:jgi/Mesvir1/20511/Mv12393-RA.1